MLRKIQKHGTRAGRRASLDQLGVVQRFTALVILERGDRFSAKETSAPAAYRSRELRRMILPLDVRGSVPGPRTRTSLGVNPNVSSKTLRIASWISATASTSLVRASAATTSASVAVSAS